MYCTLTSIFSSSVGYIFANTSGNSLSFLIEIIEFSFRTEPRLLAETEILRESVAIL